ncbi:MAG: hypothetical protein ABI743_05345 [bacterium]
MTLPMAKWAFRTHDKSIGEGDIPAMMMLDTILPWTTGTTPAGQFEGYERNMNLAGPPKNFPSSRVLNTVILNPVGLKESSTAPFRTGGKGKDDWKAPFSDTNGVTSFLAAYATAYKDTNTYFILMLPERELMNLYFDGSVQEYPGAHPSPDPIPADGATSLQAIVEYIWTPANNLLDKFLGYVLTDEPDDLNNRRFSRFATPANMANLRARIRCWELQSRTTELTGLSDRQKRARLMPCLLTFSSGFSEISGSPQPGAYASATVPCAAGCSPPAGCVEKGAADVYLFDRYPWRRSRTKMIAEDGYSPSSLVNSAYATTDPVRSNRIFRDLRNQINGSLHAGQLGYKPVLSWQQNTGWPWRPDSATPGPTFDPAGIPAPDYVPGSFIPIQRYYERPVRYQLRFDLWAALEEGSEGIALYAQFHSSDYHIQSVVQPVLEEFAYFAPMRVSRKELPQPGSISVSVREGAESGTSRERLPRVARLFEFIPEDADPAAPAEKWLMLLNRTPVGIWADCTFSQALALRYDLQSYFLLTPEGPPYSLNANPLTLAVGAHWVRLLKLVPKS